MAQKSRNRVELKLIRGNHNASKTPKPDIELYKRQVAKGKVREKEINPTMVYNLADYPVTIDYGDEKIRLSPRAITKVGDHEKLDKDSLPKEIALKHIPKRKISGKVDLRKDDSQDKSEKKVSSPKVSVKKKTGRKRK